MNSGPFPFQGWMMLYGRLSPRDQYYLKTFASGLPVIGSVIRTQDNMAYMDDYLRNRGLSYSQVKYASRTSGAQAMGGIPNFVSSNIRKLYK